MTSAPDINHMPFDCAPEEQFQGPSGDWFYAMRSIVLDGWLFWRHALPESRMRQRVPLDVACNITGLARAIHAAHTHFVEYRQLGDTPFTVSRWWDPGDGDGEWATGRRALLRMKNYNAARLSSKLTAKNRVIVEPRSENWIEVALPKQTQCEVHSLDYELIVTTEGSQRSPVPARDLPFLPTRRSRTAEKSPAPA